MLNETDKNGMEGLTKSDQDLLKTAQRAWIDFRNAECGMIRTMAPKED